MSFSFFESFINEDKEVEILAKGLYESLSQDSQRAIIVETADGVLGQLYAKLRNGGQFTDSEAEDYAQVLTGLSILSVDDNRQAFNIDISQQAGQQKFLNVMQQTGQNQNITGQVRRIARDNASGEYKRNLRQLQTFRQMTPAQQQQLLVSINKLRLGYERLKNQLADGTFQQKREQAGL